MSAYCFWCCSILRNTLYLLLWYLLACIDGCTIFASPAIVCIAARIFGNTPAANAPRIAEPSKTDSFSTGNNTGKLITSAWICTNKGLRLKPPHIRMEKISLCPDFFRVSKMCLVPYCYKNNIIICFIYKTDSYFKIICMFLFVIISQTCTTLHSYIRFVFI